MNDALCVDASLVAKWFLPEADSALALEFYARARSRNVRLIGPPPLAAEVCSAAYKQVRDGLLEVEDAVGIVEDFSRLPLETVAPPGIYALALRMAARFTLRFPYNACYLAVGELLDCEVWTADAAFHRVAHTDYPRLRLLGNR